MDPRKVHDEILGISKDLAKFSMDLSGRAFQASQNLREHPVVRASDEDARKEGRDILDQELEAFRKGHGWWLPPHNLGVNEALMGVNLWRFTILPLFPKKKAYSEEHNGIVIHPIWTSLGNDTYDLTPELAKKMIAAARKQPTIQEDVRKELKWMETYFKIRIPESIKSSLLKEALKTASRRWSIDRLRVKDRLIPLDGSKPRDLGMFGF